VNLKIMNRIAAGLFILAFCFSQPVYAQEAEQMKLYRTQFLELRSQAKSLLEQVDKIGKGKNDEKAKLDLQKDMFGLTKMAHHLEDQVTDANLAGLKGGQEDNKTLLLISQGCKALDFVLNALDYFVSTDDKAFLALAKEGEGLIVSIEKAL
jgi:hypothetical protein